jgi:hypothetical protein
MITATENLSRLTSARNEMEAGIVVRALEQEGIQATMSGVYTAGFRAEAPGWVEVLVAEQDLPQAQSILQRVRTEDTDVDWSQIDVGDPETENDVDRKSTPQTGVLTVCKRFAQVLIIAYLVWLLWAMLFSDALSRLLRAGDA